MSPSTKSISSISGCREEHVIRRFNRISLDKATSREIVPMNWIWCLLGRRGSTVDGSGRESEVTCKGNDSEYFIKCQETSFFVLLPFACAPVLVEWQFTS